jgi:uncharacterized protein (DUF1778 family)
MRNAILNIRTTDKNKYLLQQAADMLGITVSGFLLNTATEKAQQLIQNQNHFALDNEHWDIFCRELDRKPSQNLKLQGLLKSKSIFQDE